MDVKIPLLYTTFNRLEYTKRTLPRLIEATPEAEIYIVDNGSTDGTQEYLYSLDLQLDTAYRQRRRITYNAENIGIANVMNWFFESIANT